MQREEVKGPSNLRDKEEQLDIPGKWERILARESFHLGEWEKKLPNKISSRGQKNGGSDLQDAT